MTNSRENQNSKLTPAERRVKKTNAHLREELGINIRIDLAGTSLRIRKTLPPRPGSKQTKWYQQTITLGLTADQKGVGQALQDVVQLNALLSQRKFDWKTWNQYLNRPCQHRVKQTELIGTQIKRFKEHLLASEKITQEKTWKSQWSWYFNKLPSDKYLTDQIILDAINQKTEEGSDCRQRFCHKLKKLVEFLDVTTELNFTELAKGYKLPIIKEDKLPTDKEILSNLDLINEPEWRTAYMLQAVFGLRNHEVFFLDRSKIESYKDITVLKVSEETKTGFHAVAALYPEWFDDERWNLKTAKLPEIDLDLEKTTLKEIGHKVTKAFKRFGIAFTPYKLRHSWARRAMEFGFTDETAAEFMGHSVQVHQKHYHRLIAMKHGFRIVQSYMSNPNRPKPPQR